MDQDEIEFEEAQADPETARILAAHARGELEQRCPDCGHEEAAGYSCTRCQRPIDHTVWRTWAQLHPERAAELRERAIKSGAIERFAQVRAAQAAKREAAKAAGAPAKGKR